MNRKYFYITFVLVHELVIFLGENILEAPPPIYTYNRTIRTPMIWISLHKIFDKHVHYTTVVFLTYINKYLKFT